MDKAANRTVKGEKIIDIKLGGLMKNSIVYELLTVEKIVCKAFQITLLDNIPMLHSPFSPMDRRRGHQDEIFSSDSNQASSYT
jgi:hypothetical protein